MKTTVMGVEYTIMRKQPLRNDPSYWVIHAFSDNGRATVHTSTEAFLGWATREGMVQRSERRPMGVMKAALLRAGLQ